jgi:PST family polysaccharide transporter
MSSDQKSYSRILKSSSLIGGAQGINMLVGMVRVKFVAVLIGPVGVGLVGTYRVIVQLIGTLAGLGLQSSAVRDIAEAAGSDDQERIGRAVLTLRRMCWLTGGLGALLVTLFSKALSQITFSSPDFALEISLVGLTILFANVQSGQMALVQGMRRISDLARINVYGVTFGSAVSIGLYWWLGKGGIVPAIVLLGIIQLLVSWWFARRIKVPKVQMSWMESFQAAGGMVILGLAFMWSGLLTAGVAYTTRALIAHEIDLVAVGIFSAAFNLSGMIVDFVLGAMRADYYPGLIAVNRDHTRMRELVNQQTEIGLLLALPGLLATLALAPWAIKIFYSSEFRQAADLLRWFVLGCLGRVISWPIGFVILAKGRARLFAAIQTWANFMHIGLIWGLLAWVGLIGSAQGFCFLYVLYTILMLIVSRHIIDFSWSKGVWTLLAVILPVVFGAFALGMLLPELPATLVGLSVTATVSIYCLRGLIYRLGSKHKISRLLCRIPLFNCLIPKKEVAV